MKSNVKLHYESEDCEVYFTLLNNLNTQSMRYLSSRFCSRFDPL